MKKELGAQTDVIDVRTLRHILTGALASFRLAHEILLEDGDRMEAKTVFDSGEEKLEKALAILPASKKPLST